MMIWILEHNRWEDICCVFQVKEVVEVDGDVAEILARSRFSDKFTLLPPRGASQPCVGSPKVSATVSPKIRHVEL